MSVLTAVEFEGLRMAYTLYPVDTLIRAGDALAYARAACPEKSSAVYKAREYFASVVSHWRFEVADCDSPYPPTMSANELADMASGVLAYGEEGLEELFMALCALDENEVLAPHLVARLNQGVDASASVPF